MKFCSFCGCLHTDKAAHCRGCGAAFSLCAADLEPKPLNLKRHALACCGIYSRDQPRRTPRFTLIALAAPFVSFFVAEVFVRNRFRDPHDGLAAYAYFMLIWLLGMVLGGLAALVGLGRAERYRGVGWLGVLMNFGPVLCCFIYAWTHR
jgi:hypothetical protein